MKPSSQSIDFLFTVTIKVEPTNSDISFKSLKGNHKESDKAAQYIPYLPPPNQ